MSKARASFDRVGYRGYYKTLLEARICRTSHEALHMSGRELLRQISILNAGQ